MPQDVITTDELAKRLGGGDCFIRSRNGEVTGMAVRLDLNPEAPNRLIVGKGPQLKSRSEKLVEADSFVPLFIKKGTNQWEFLGNYRATNFDTRESEILRYRKHRRLGVSGILFLESEEEAIAHQAGWAESTGFIADPERRKEIEQSAVRHVTIALEEQGFKVESRESENVGYDLEAVKGSEIKRVEVKGTTSQQPAFILSANEFRVSKAVPGWELRVVTEADSSPRSHCYSASEMNLLFSMEAMTYRCELKSIKKDEPE